MQITVSKYVRVIALYNEFTVALICPKTASRTDRNLSKKEI